MKNPNKLKFFNSLTIVLLPKDGAGNIQKEFQDYPNNDPRIPYQDGNDFDAFFAADDWDHQAFGGVQFVATTSAALSRLRWDRKRVDAVAVDGQHRLKSLKLWMEGKNNELVDVEKPTRIPVIFLLLDDKVGFRCGTGSNNSGIKAIAREIFTDLNKNAREVDMATQIILDDRSIASCCVRELVTDSTCTDDDTLLPLSLLRWQEANNRFDQKYYLNSLVNLHLIVEDLLDLEPPTKEAMNKARALSFIEKASRQLGTGPQRRLEDRGVDLKEYYEKEFLDDDGDPTAPLTGIPPQFLPAATAGFKEHFAAWMLRLLRDFKPYSDLIAYARKNDLISGEFAQYRAQPKDHQFHLQKVLANLHGDRWKHLVLDQHDEAIEGIKGVRDSKGEQWAFKTIFQKAVMRLGKRLFFETPENERERLGSVDDFLKFMNRLYEHDVFRVLAPLQNENYRLWTFISVNYGSEKIKVASTSEKRILAILTLWYFASRYATSENRALSFDQENDEHVTTTEVLRYFSTKGAQAQWPAVHDHYQELFREFQKNSHLISGKSELAELSDQKQKQVAKARLQAVFDAGLRPWIAPQPVATEQEASGPTL
ncbi:DNA sulfur modification protein DndB [Luteolibacter marinus]|uniref:DNA sulfur modification protein DndB n=1 Tax=Luteolibacter marinus TaxID=2776705 RepID=UPI001D01B048|nr:DNA sulfur modification protein DndB [Luteolibacter marinus]